MFMKGIFMEANNKVLTKHFLQERNMDQSVWNYAFIRFILVQMQTMRYTFSFYLKVIYMIIYTN